MKKGILVFILLAGISTGIFANTENLKKGIAYLNKNKYKDAEIYLLKALDEDRNKNTYFYLALLYSDEKKYSLAEENYKKAIENGSINAINNLALIYAEQGKTEQAEEYYKMAIIKNIDSAAYNLGNLYYIEDKIELARKYYKMAAEKGDEQAKEMLEIIDLELNQIFYEQQ